MSDRKLKRTVLHLISSFHQGGSERQALQLARLLKQSGRYQVRLACLDGGGALRDEAERIGLGDIPEYRLTSFYDRNMATQLLRFARFLRQNEISIAQTHDFYTNVFGMMAAQMAGVRVRIAARRETAGWRSKAQKVVERLSYRMAHAIVANSEAVRQQLIKEGTPAKKIIAIHNGLDPQRVTPPSGATREQMLASFGLPRYGSLSFVAIVANLRHPVKDHPTFLKAASRVYRIAPYARFIVAGEGELIRPMRHLAQELGIDHVTHFIGRCNRVAQLLAISDVCVLSSKAEGFSNSILEYMAAGRPAVVTDVGGAREAVVDGETGFITPPGDDEALAQAVIRLLDDSELAQKMGERGRKRIQEKFSSQSQLESIESLYDRLLLPSRSAAPRRLNIAEG
jgi:glycosyltransferase involved in cell wall biosynthesis